MSESAKKMFSKKLAKSDQEKEDMDNSLSFLIQKKTNEYSHINRFIVDYQYTETRRNKRLNIASTIANS